MNTVPTAMVAARDIVIGGTTIAAGTVLTSAQIATVSKVQSLLANGSVKVTPDPAGRRGGYRQPTYLSPGMVKSLIASVQAEEEKAARAAEKAKAKAKAEADAAAEPAVAIEAADES